MESRPERKTRRVPDAHGFYRAIFGESLRLEGWRQCFDDKAVKRVHEHLVAAAYRAKYPALGHRQFLAQPIALVFGVGFGCAMLSLGGNIRRLLFKRPAECDVQFLEPSAHE